MPQVGTEVEFPITPNKSLISDRDNGEEIEVGVYTEEPFLSILKAEKFHVVFEVGSRDGLDALRIQDAYNPDLTCVFEPNPEAVQLVQTNLEGSERIRFFAAACWNVTGSIPFYPVLFSIPKGGPPERNIGASSCYRDARTCEERLFQTHITVEAIRLDELIAREGIGAPDLVCMDVQGATLNVLQGLGAELSNVRWVLTEAEMLTMYMGEALLPEIEQYLGSYGFSRVAEKPANEFFGDYLFKNLNH